MAPRRCLVSTVLVVLMIAPGSRLHTIWEESISDGILGGHNREMEFSALKEGTHIQPMEVEGSGAVSAVLTASNVTDDSGNPQRKQRLGFLDQMFVDYDKRAWPTYGKEVPTLVTVNIYINSVGSVSAANMEFGMDIYLRQSWMDSRLATSKYGITSTVTMNGEDIVDKIWKPDLFFRNVKQANFHFVTVPNNLIKLSPEGDILYSMRLTLRLACRMTFEKYPLDTQLCHVVVGSYAQPVTQVKVQWQKKNPIVIDGPLELPEFDMVKYTYGNFTREIDTGAFSFLNASFVLVRQNGYHLVQTYLPTFLIVMISWVSFWLNVDAVPARVTLGVTTLLTLTTVASGVRTQLPPVSYVKAIDVWIGVCSIMVFGALLEFTLVNYLSRSKKNADEMKKSLISFSRSKDAEGKNGKPDDQTQIQTQSIPSSTPECNILRANTVDRTCRVGFPLAFFLFNAVYWPYYLYF